MSNATNNPFKKAVKHEAKLRLAITGPSGSGKTYTALAIATNLATPVALIDTEHGSAAKYGDQFEFDTIDLDPPYHPDRFVELIKVAAEAGYKTVVIDSMTHAWNGEGGMLDIVNAIAKRSNAGNSFTAWKDGTPIQNKFINSILTSPIHVIATMRSKQESVLEKDERTGKMAPRKVGMAAVQRDGMEYEFDIVLDMNLENEGSVSKTRASVLAGGFFVKPGKDFAKILTNWLAGAPAEVKAELATEGDIRTLHALGETVYPDWKKGVGKDVLKDVIGRAETKGMTLADYQKVVAHLNKILEEDKATAAKVAAFSLNGEQANLLNEEGDRADTEPAFA